MATASSAWGSLRRRCLLYGLETRICKSMVLVREVSCHPVPSHPDRHRSQPASRAGRGRLAGPPQIHFSS